MKTHGPQFFFFLLVTAGAISLACGSSPHVLQSVNISPASADALNYSGGQVPFTASGSYSRPPSPVSPLSATWGACDQGGNSTNQVTVSANGLAQCTSGAAGTFIVWAFATNPSNGTANCNVLTASVGAAEEITGTAQLTCP